MQAFAGLAQSFACKTLRLNGALATLTSAAHIEQVLPGPEGRRVYSPAGVSITLTSTAGGFGGRSGLYDVTLPIKVMTKDAGIGKFKGGKSGVFVEGKAPFAVPVQDADGTLHYGKVRKLMPIECWWLQGFSDEQFYRAAATGLSDAQLYKMAGNAVTMCLIGKQVYLCEFYLSVRRTGK